MTVKSDRRQSGMAGRLRRFAGIAVALACTFSWFGASVNQASADQFDRFVREMWPKARAAGVSRQTYNSAFRGVRPDPEIFERAGAQPEFVKPIWEYLNRAASDERVIKGQGKAQEWGNILNAIEAIYGVDRHIVLAIWGMESNYGGFQGDKSVIRSLATLAYTGERTKFGRSQLIAALQILRRGDIPAKAMTGSWAGAMGHTQFIPTTYNAYAVDFDKDGRRDIWSTVPDALASTANYLRRSGWAPGEPWAYEVELPRGFNFALVDGKSRAVRSWASAGIRRPGGERLSHAALEAQLITPAGANGPAFLVFRNFKAILRYNNSHAYALGVGHLADRLTGAGPFVQAWPNDDRPLARSEREHLQELLAARGYSVGKIDGVIGASTTAAIRHFQATTGLAPDGHPSYKLLQRLKMR